MYSGSKAFSILILVLVTQLRAQELNEEKSPSSRVAAILNGEKITEVEVLAGVRAELRGQRATPGVANELRRQVLQYIIDGRIVEQFLAKKNVQADAEQVESVIQNLRQRVKAAGLNFRDVLNQQGQTEASLRSRIAGQLAFQKYADAQVTEMHLQSYFNQHKVEFDGTEVRASHLLIKQEPTASKEERQAAMTKIESIRKEIHDGLKFAEAAKRYSEGPSGPNGGDLGFFPRRNRMVEPFAAAAFAMKKGEVSRPVETQFGLHLIKVTDRTVGTKKFADVRNSVKNGFVRELWRKTVAEQRQSAKIEIIDPKSGPNRAK